MRKTIDILQLILAMGLTANLATRVTVIAAGGILGERAGTPALGLSINAVTIPAARRIIIVTLKVADRKW